MASRLPPKAQSYQQKPIQTGIVGHASASEWDKNVLQPQLTDRVNNIVAHPIMGSTIVKDVIIGSTGVTKVPHTLNRDWEEFFVANSTVGLVPIEATASADAPKNEFLCLTLDQERSRESTRWAHISTTQGSAVGAWTSGTLYDLAELPFDLETELISNGVIAIWAEEEGSWFAIEKTGYYEISYSITNATNVTTDFFTKAALYLNDVEIAGSRARCYWITNIKPNFITMSGKAGLLINSGSIISLQQDHDKGGSTGLNVWSAAMSIRETIFPISPNFITCSLMIT